MQVEDDTTVDFPSRVSVSSDVWSLGNGSGKDCYRERRRKGVPRNPKQDEQAMEMKMNEIAMRKQRLPRLSELTTERQKYLYKTGILIPAGGAGDECMVWVNAQACQAPPFDANRYKAFTVNKHRSQAYPLVEPTEMMTTYQRKSENNPVTFEIAVRKVTMDDKDPWQALMVIELCEVCRRYLFNIYIYNNYILYY